MVSRSSSHSDGEVLSSDSEKATTSLPSRRNNNIDRHIRTSTPQSSSSKPVRSRSRSRSPYRSSASRKRRREDEYSSSRERLRADSRTFNVKYENERHLDGRSSREAEHRSHVRNDHGDGRRQHLKRPRTRSRSRSRSPYRSSKETRQSRDPLQTQSHSKDSTSGARTTHTASQKIDPIGKSRNAMGSQTLSANADITQNITITDKYGGSKQKDKATATERVVNQQENNDRSYDLASPLDEAGAIEARRKRRETIKNKYRNQAPSLLVQALHTRNPSEISTSNAVSITEDPSTGQCKSPILAASLHLLIETASPAQSNAASPKADSDPSSPADISFDQDDSLVKDQSSSPKPDGADEPSAADYDPTIDMQEERARHDRSLFKEDVVSLQKATDPAFNRTVQPISPATEQLPKKAKTDFDMFAEDDDDDMFAEAPMKSNEGSIEKTAMALDATMMDDWDDSEGYYNTILGELIQNRYHVTQNIGRGMFSSVVRATDNSSGNSVAIKIVRNNEVMRKAGIKEIDILEDIGANDPDDKKHLIRLQGSFDHKGHLCMVFENLSMNLREVLKKFGRDVGINIKAIRAYAQQLFLGLSLLKRCQYLHADLKPDNMLVNESRNLVKICDLGSASPISENSTAPYLVSRFYRAPEIILGIPYDYAIDMWSVGCTLFELYTGKILFTGRNNNGMLRNIMECRGKFPHKLLRKGAFTYEYFDDLLNFQSQESDKLSGRTIVKTIEVKAKPLRDLRLRLMPKGKRLDEQERKEVELFTDLLDKCLDLRPDKRITPTECLKHPFILRAKA